MVLVSMLRGVNLGPHHRIKMTDLKALYESLGYTGVETLIQSGNVVFRTVERSADRVAARIESGIEERFGFRAPAVVRTAAELRSVVERNPFAGRDGIEPSKLAVNFLARAPEAAARTRLRALPEAPEEVVLDGRELYIYFPNGMARPKLSPAQLDRAVGVAMTARNWNTVGKLLEMAERLERAAK
jgi:uncharacterized protein (DUF1697 family)